MEDEMNAGGPNSKHCPKCNRDLPHESFYIQPSRQDGLSGWCMDCHRAQGKLPRERKPKELDRFTRRKIAKALKMEDCGDGLVDLTVHREFIVRELLAIVVTTKSEVKKLEALKMIEKLGVIPA